MRLLTRLEYEQKSCASCRTYSVRVPKRTLRCQAYVRYVDDMQLFADDKQQLWQCKLEIENYLSHLRLQIHSGAHPRPVTEGFGFLGFQLFPERKRLKKRKGTQYQQHLKKLLTEYKNGVITQDTVLDSVMAWNNHLRYGNTLGLRQQVFSALPEELAVEAQCRYQRIKMKRTKSQSFKE